MQEQIAMQNLLRSTFSELQRRNPNFSLRAYAKKLGIHAGALSYILNGKRNVSRDLAERIAQRLLLDPQRRSEILDLFPIKRAYRKAASSDDPASSRYLAFTAAQFKITSEWEHLAVMSLLKCHGFESSPVWIADRLGISVPRASQVIERLLELGLFSRSAEGDLTRSPGSFRTSDDIANLSIQKHHEQTLDLAKDSLQRDAVAIRDFTSLTMAIDPKKLSAAKELIRRQQDELSELLESGHSTEVYRLSVQLFPLSKMRTGV